MEFIGHCEIYTIWDLELTLIFNIEIILGIF